MATPLLETPLIDLLTIFGAGFVSVFALGFQSRNVNHGNYSWAAGTSLFVGFSQAYLWKHIIDIGTMAAAATYAVSGSIAITSSMFVHEKFIRGRESLGTPLRKDKNGGKSIDSDNLG